MDLDLLSRITSSLFTVDRRVVSSLAARVSDNASRARDAGFFGTEGFVMVTRNCDDFVGSGHFKLHIPVMGYSLEACKGITPQ